MKISSTAFENEATIPAKYTCDGDDVNPPLAFSDIPLDAKSLALIVEDPDAPSRTWVHWVLFNMDPTLTGISEDSTPENAKEGITSSAQVGYGGPCPPSGVHRYFFKLYALDAQLSLTSSANAQDLEKAMDGHIIAQAQLMGKYSRNTK